jgi:phage repressor protein C with HTH and peptisase S24 domain
LRGSEPVVNWEVGLQLTLKERLLAEIGKEKPYAWAARHGISKATLHHILEKNGNPRSDQLLKLSKATKRPIEYLLVGEGPEWRDEVCSCKEPPEPYQSHFNEDYVLVPRYEVRASAGGGALVHSEQIVDHLAFKTEWVKNALGVSIKDLALITVVGDSMETTLSNGDLILLDMTSKRVEDNAIYAIQFSGTLLVKRIQRRLDGSVVIKSDNKVYEAETINEEALEGLNIIGRVVWAGRRM